MRAFPPRLLLILLSFQFCSAAPGKDAEEKSFSERLCRNPFCHSAHSKDGQSCEPLPPDVLDVIAEKSEESGDLTIDVTVRPNNAASVQLITPTATGLKRLGGNVGMKPKALAKGATSQQKLKLHYSDRKLPEKLVFRALLKNEQGKVLADVSEVVEVNPELSVSDPSEERVAVIINSGGRRLVQYMTPEQAAGRGLTPAPPRREASLPRPIQDDDEAEEPVEEEEE